MNTSRTKNLTLNVIFGYVAQICIMLLQFIGRRIFVEFLPSDYLGINGLYGNILTVLSIAELGLNTVVQFYFYKPVLENDRPLVRTLLRYFKKLYYFIAGAVTIIGIALIPFLKYIINSDLEQNELILYYVLFLANTVISYFSAQKIALLAAYQDNRLQKVVTLATNILLQILHILVLLIWKNYTIYVLTTLLTTIVNVILMNIICNRRYPYITEKDQDVEINKREIVKSVKSTFIYKVGGVLLNNTDNILISVIVSTVVVGLYSNYYMVLSAVQGFITIITTSIISAIGNLVAEGNKEKLKNVFNTVLFFYNIVAVFGGICFNFLFNEFIGMWLGEEYLLDTLSVFAISFSFFLTNAISPIWMCREASGLFSKVRYLLLVTAGANLVLSILLGNYFGIFGILIATSLSRILTTFWYEPRVLFKNLFGKGEGGYWLRQLKYFVLAGLSFGISYLIYGMIPTGFGFLFVKAIVFFLITVLLFVLTSIGTNELKDTIKMAKRLFGRMTKKKKRN